MNVKKRKKVWTNPDGGYVPESVVWTNPCTPWSFRDNGPIDE
jgi:hypothetical protein